MSGSYTLNFNRRHTIWAGGFTTQVTPPDLQVTAPRTRDSCQQEFCSRLEPGTYQLVFDRERKKWTYTALQVTPFTLTLNAAVLIEQLKVGPSADLLQPTRLDLDAAAIGLAEPEQLSALFSLVPGLLLIEGVGNERAECGQET